MREFWHGTGLVEVDTPDHARYAPQVGPRPSVMPAQTCLIGRLLVNRSSLSARDKLSGAIKVHLRRAMLFAGSGCRCEEVIGFLEVGVVAPELGDPSVSDAHHVSGGLR